MNNKIPLTGAHAGAEAFRQIRPDVMPMFPITPQTPLVERFSEMVAEGKVDTEIIHAESEHSAMSAAVGAAAAGAKTMTASSSQGIGLMAEILPIASGLRLPILMAVGSRAISAPINIHCDHSDSMMTRDFGWLQIFTENAQEYYDNVLMAFKLAYQESISLPVMVMMDGFINTHLLEGVELLADEKASEFIGEYKSPYSVLDIKNPIMIGPLALPDSFFEIKRQQIDAMEAAYKEYVKITKDYVKYSGRKYDYYEEYELDDAQAAIITIGSSAGVVKSVIDKMRSEGKKVGLLKIRLFRPFPYKEIADALKNIKTIGIFDRSVSFGADAPLFGEIKSALFNSKNKPSLSSYVYGLGGKNLYEKQVEEVFNDLFKEKTSNEVQYIM